MFLMLYFIYIERKITRFNLYFLYNKDMKRMKKKINEY